MEITVENEGACRRTLKIEVPADSVQSSFDEIAQEFIKYAEVPGYRKGRAPATMVKTRFKKKILEQVRDRLVPESYQNAIKEQDLQVASIVSASDPEVDVGEPLRFEVVLDVVPDFELPEYKGLSITREEEEIDEEKVNEVINQICEQHVSFEDREKGDLVAENDLVQVTYTGTVDGTDLTEIEDLPPLLAGQEDFWTQANDERPIVPGLGTVLIGLAVGDSTDMDVEFDEEEMANPPEALAGKTVKYHVSVGAARARNVPEMDEKIAKAVGFDSIEALRTDIEENGKKQAVSQADEKVRNDVIEALTKDLEFDMPESIVEAETREEIHSTVSHFSRQGVDDSVINDNKDEIFDRANTSARTRLKVKFLCKKIAKAEEIEISNREVDDELRGSAAQYGMELNELRQKLADGGRLESVRDDLLIKKTIDFLVEQADIQG